MNWREEVGDFLTAYLVLFFIINMLSILRDPFWQYAKTALFEFICRPFGLAVRMFVSSPVPKRYFVVNESQ